MNKFMKKALATLLALVMISSAFVCLAAVELNQEAADAHKGQYGKYLLLGDSAATGYRDVLSDGDNNDLYNKKYNQSVYTVVPGSYADIIGKAIGADTVSYAGPGYRTIEVRYMLEDDYAASCEDKFLFWPSQLYVYKNQVCSCHNQNLLPGSQHFRDAYQKSVAEADLITLGVGGNDWGEYMKWALGDVLLAENAADEYIAQAKELLETTTMPLETIEKVVEIAHAAGALPALLTTAPKALEYGLSTFYENWNHMIEAIYDLNPDVTLMVVSMSDNGNKGYYYDYDGVKGEKIPVTEQEEPIATAVETLVDLIMGIGNGPMKNGAEIYGYTYVDIDGATYVTYHYDADGHAFVANKILELLPNKDIFNKFEDVTPGHKYYNGVEYVVVNGIMAPKADNVFGVDEYITESELAAALGKDIVDSDKEITVVGLAFAIIGAGASRGFASFFKGLGLACKIMAYGSFNIGGKITRGLAADYLQTFYTM